MRETQRSYDERGLRRIGILGRLLLWVWIGVGLLPLGVPLKSLAVELGIDRLQANGFDLLKGKRVGLITNHTGVDSRGRKTREILFNAKGVRLTALYSPEHGLDGTELAGKYVATRKDPLTGLTVYSLYGPTRKPTPAMLKDVDLLVYDMQDIGVRSYTYISTMARCMEAAGEAGIEFLVLDRPNPLGGLRVEGPPVEPEWISFVGQLPVPYVHGMTCGELARMLNERQWMAARCRLKVMTMDGWERRMLWEDTGLRWIKTSPNIPRPDSPAYYVATGIVGSLTGADNGVGGPIPFQICAGKGLDPERFTGFVRGLGLEGIRAKPYISGGLNGCTLQIDPGGKGNLCFLALALLSEVNRNAQPDLFARSSADKLDIFYKVYGSRSIVSQLRQGMPIQRIAGAWQPSVERFRKERSAYLFY
jgi:uncharacterized protein YbbC (DUF1343 family)